MARMTTKTKRRPVKSSVVSDMPASVDAPANKTSKLGKYKYAVLLIFLVLLGALAYLGKGLFVAAVVNGKPISRFEILKSLETKGGKQALEGLVTRELIYQEARKQNVNVSGDEVNTEIDKIAKSLEGSGSTLDATLAMEGVSRTELEDNIRMKLTAEKLLSSEIAVNDDEVKKYFDENKSAFAKDAKYDDLKESLRTDLKEEKFSGAFQNWYKKLHSESSVQYFVNYQ